MTVQARGTLVSLVSPRRTMAVLKPTTKSCVDLGLRLDTTEPGGRLQPARDLGMATVWIPLTTPGEVDDEVRAWLMKAYDENTAPPAGKPRPPARPKPVLGTMTVVIEGIELPGRSCQPEPDGTVHRNIHVALATTAKGIAEGQPWLNVPLKPGLAAEPFPGDAKETRWEVTVTVRGSAGDGYDFTGPSVGGDRTDRHLGLVWGDVPGDGTLRTVPRRQAPPRRRPGRPHHRCHAPRPPPRRPRPPDRRQRQPASAPACDPRTSPGPPSRPDRRAGPARPAAALHPAVGSAGIGGRVPSSADGL